MKGKLAFITTTIVIDEEQTFLLIVMSCARKSVLILNARTHITKLSKCITLADINPSSANATPIRTANVTTNNSVLLHTPREKSRYRWSTCCPRTMTSIWRSTRQCGARTHSHMTVQCVCMLTTCRISVETLSPSVTSPRNAPTGTSTRKSSPWRTPGARRACTATSATGGWSTGTTPPISRNLSLTTSRMPIL